MPVVPDILDAARRGQPAPHRWHGPMNQRVYWGVWMLSMLWPGWLFAAAPPADPPATGAPAVIQAADAQQPAARNVKSAKPAPTDEQKRKVVVLTSLVIAGILAVLLFLLLWIVWWSRRTHRLLRAPLPAANRGDELWYLKAKRHPSQNADQPSSGPPAPPQM
jgi:hypothetical protein